ncbi:unnamed protein product [Onchocerca flexuosa]|uniref:Uncharacterized protein n=1 Tax=Onchocerca flexuosa TaxID=387005 RepID=A0A183HU56_9BILA|nr:unnamed protein product [Onchocerca flexuosa]
MDSTARCYFKVCLLFFVYQEIDKNDNNISNSSSSSDKMMGLMNTANRTGSKDSSADEWSMNYNLVGVSSSVDDE